MAARSEGTRGGFALDPVTFEVLKNSFITTVDQMAEQILRTCYSFVIYNRDFSNALHDANGDSIAQGNQDIAVHVGTLHWTCKDVIRAFAGDMREGDVYAINDPYAGGYVTRHYGRPRERVHALQIEIARTLYMDEAQIEKRPGFAEVREHLSALVATLAAAAPDLLRG